MNNVQRADGRPVEASSASPAWWVVLKKELRDLWVGGKALNLTIAYTVFISGYAYWTAHDSSVSLIPPKEMVFEMIKSSLMVGVFMSLIIGADSLSGERERATLEALLLTPTSRRQIVVGKFLAAISTWPVAMAITVPYLKVLSQGDEVFGQAVIWGAALGCVIVPGFAALGMLVSFWSSTNKTSMFVSLAIYLVFLLPTQLVGTAQGGAMGLLFQAVNPMQGPRHFLARVLVNNRSAAESYTYIVSTCVFFVVLLGMLFWYAGPSLRLEAGREKRRWATGNAAVLALLACLIGLFGAVPAMAQAPADAHTLQIAIDKTDTIVRAGAPVLFNTEISNRTNAQSRPIIVAMNIINLNAKGEIVDPEDWAPQRTQYVEPLPAGQSKTLNWRVNSILDGEYMVYMVAIPAPASADTTSQPVASSGIHLTVTPYTKLNPRGVLPYALGGPLLLGLVISYVYRHRRRQIDMGG